jgi:hypothetical protein
LQRLTLQAQIDEALAGTPTTEGFRALAGRLLDLAA